MVRCNRNFCITVVYAIKRASIAPVSLNAAMAMNRTYIIDVILTSRSLTDSTFHSIREKASHRFRISITNLRVGLNSSGAGSSPQKLPSELFPPGSVLTRLRHEISSHTNKGLEKDHRPAGFDGRCEWDSILLFLLRRGYGDRLFGCFNLARDETHRSDSDGKRIKVREYSPAVNLFAVLRLEHPPVLGSHRRRCRCVAHQGQFVRDA